MIGAGRLPGAGQALPVHGFRREIHFKVVAVHWILSLVQRLIQADAAFGLLHPSGPVH